MVNKHLTYAAVLLAGITSISCEDKSTKASFIEQRKIPFFKVVAYERFHGDWDAGILSVWLFEDEAGNCYITSGEDGGITIAPKSACEKAKMPSLEEK